MIGIDVTAWLLFALTLSAAAIVIFTPIAPRIGLVDIPGGRKRHRKQTPLVGGVGIYGALAIVLLLQLWLDPTDRALVEALVISSTVLFGVGLLDDIRQLGVSVRLAAQVIAAFIAAMWGGIVLNDFGFLLGANLQELGTFALPVTLFAIVGMVNAFNMIDGIDGLSGSLSVVSAALLAIVAFNGGQAAYLLILLALLGALVGFLVFNMRCCGRRQANVFMGDAGSTVLGFLFACLAIGLTQGEARSMSPVTALWLFAVPLADALVTMLRRLWSGRSPFYPDRTHLHHLLLDAGMTVPQSVALMALLQLIVGALGLIGYYIGIPEFGMFAAFLILIGVYAFGVSRPWVFVDAAQKVHRRLDLPVSGVSAVFIGGLPQQGADGLLRKILGEDFETYGYELYAQQHDKTDGEHRYAIVCVGCELAAPRIIRKLRNRARSASGVVIRQFIPRRTRSNRDNTALPAFQGTDSDRRGGGRLVAIADIDPWGEPTTVNAPTSRKLALASLLGLFRLD